MAEIRPAPTRPTARSFLASLVLLLPRGAREQSAIIDWSSVELDAAGHQATFGPRVDVPEPQPPDVNRLCGFFANADGFFGRAGFVEYQQVRRGEDGRIEALKIVGDQNVPRGYLTWRTARGQASVPTWRMPISLQLRDDLTDDGAFWWSPGHSHEVELDPAYDVFHILGQNPGLSHRARFYRVSEAEALEAARTVMDAP